MLQITRVSPKGLEHQHRATPDERFNDMRNQRWLEKLPAIMADKSSFIAVGCLHLAGETGLLVGLEKAGYTVEAVRN